MTQRPTWEQYAMLLARAASFRSEDPYIQVGACALRKDRSVAGTGYNGAQSGVEIDWSDREARLKFVIHAENNALGYCTPGDVGLLACTLLPCGPCMTIIARYRVPLVVYGEVYHRDQNALDIAAKYKINLLHVPLTSLPALVQTATEIPQSQPKNLWKSVLVRLRNLVK